MEKNINEVLDLTTDIQRRREKKVIYTFHESNEFTFGLKTNSLLLKQFTDFASRKNRSMICQNIFLFTLKWTPNIKFNEVYTSRADMGSLKNLVMS